MKITQPCKQYNRIIIFKRREKINNKTKMPLWDHGAGHVLK